MDVSWLLSPFKQEDFVNGFWTKKPLRICRHDSVYYEQLFPEKEMELTLYAASQVRGAVELLSEDEIPIICRSHAQAIEGFREGRSIRIDGVHRYSHGIMALARNLEAVIHCPVNVNMYLTPGAGKKALNRHYDTHDVFVLQIHGDKVWRLYDKPYPFPLEFLPLQRYESMREMKQNRLDRDLSARASCIQSDLFTLRSGDCLYLPRGFWHEAESVPGEVSCHLTVGVQPITYLDVMSVAISQAALSNPRLRETLPFGFAAESTFKSAVVNTITEIARELPEQLDTDSALQKVISHALSSHKTGFQNNLLRKLDGGSEACLGPDSTICVREAMRCVINENSLPVRLILGAQVFEIPAKYEEACRYILKNRHFKVAELPGELTPPEKLALVQQLVSEKLLEASTPGVTASEFPGGPTGWIPINLALQADRIEWLELGRSALTMPFFQQSVEQIRKQNPKARLRSTNVRALDYLGEGLYPSGLIFHVSRCGSTLLSNGLRAIRDTVVISEAQPINEAVAALSASDSRRGSGVAAKAADHGHFLRGIVRAYGQRRSGAEKALVIKFSSWNLLHIAAIRKLWPDVPCVIITRDPLEVAVSCLSDYPGWMRWKVKPFIAQAVFGWDPDDIESMTDHAYCARALGELFNAAASAAHEGCRIIDYRDIDSSSIIETARLFGISPGTEDLHCIDKSLSIYSKDIVGKRVFVDDAELKQAKVTAELRNEIQKWVKLPFVAAQTSAINREITAESSLANT